MNIKHTIIMILMLIIMSNTAAALIEPDWAMDRPNEKLHPSDLLIDFEDGIQNEWPISNVTGVRFVDHLGFPWVYAEKNFPYMNIFPDGWDPDNAYVVNGEFGAFTCWMMIPHYAGVIEFDGGANYVSVLASNGCNLKMTAYDKRGNIIDEGVAEPNTGTLTFTRMTMTCPRSSISSVKFYGVGNFWIVDDLIVGGEPLPMPTDYAYAAERMKELLGAEFFQFGLGYNIILREFYTAEQIINNEIPGWNSYTKEIVIGKGIYDVNAIIWAFNVEEDLVNWMPIDKMAKHDFTVEVEHGEQKPGDVFFIDYEADGFYDEVGIYVGDVHYDPVMEYTVDIIRIIPGAGVSYSSTEWINEVYAFDLIAPAFVDYRRLPDNPKGGHSPYPKIPTKFEI